MLRVARIPLSHLWSKTGNQTAVCLSTTRADWLKEGDTARVTRKITKEDVAEYGELVGDHNPVHKDIVHGTFLLGLVSGVMARWCDGVMVMWCGGVKL